MSEIPEFKKGDLVVNNYGKYLTVLFQRGCQVFVEEESCWYHPTKLRKIGNPESFVFSNN